MGKTFPPDGKTCNHVTALANGGVLLTGSLETNGHARNAYLAKTGADSDRQTEITLPATEITAGVISREAVNGDLVTLGATTNGGYSAVSISKLTTGGSLLWTQEIAEAGNHLQAAALHLNADGSIILAGTTQSSMSVGSAGILLVKLDASGNEQWLKKLGGNNEDRAYNIIADGTGLVLAGNTESYGAKKGESNIFLLRINQAGEIIY